ncbi:MAG: GTPase HflX [Actinomycetia bacterium]|nr:GTPase HflX [Actinomycetes bacterium]
MTYQHLRRERRRLTATVADLEVSRQNALLVGVRFGRNSLAEAEQSLEELALLTDTAGSQPVEKVLFRRPSPDAGLLIGKGQAANLADLTKSDDIDVVVFDHSLTPAQQRNLQTLFECDVVDREAVILDIFAQHATSREGSLQVELALLRYRLPRLRGKGEALSQQAGGIGTRGPGETRLESDRRRIRQRISVLEKDLAGLRQHNQTRRRARLRSAAPTAAMVGYTNAGKSTLLNQLTGAGILTEDRLFTTLDPTIRRLRLPGGREMLLADTVGFVRRLPHRLVEAFKSTLEEVKDADLMLHLVNAADPDPEGQIKAVEDVLAEIGADAPTITVVNKIDVAPPAVVRQLLRRNDPAVAVSALTGEGATDLVDKLADWMNSRSSMMSLLVPYPRGDVVASLHRTGEVLTTDTTPNGLLITVRLPPDQVHHFSPFTAPDSQTGSASPTNSGFTAASPAPKRPA